MPGAGNSSRASRKRGTDTRPQGGSVGRELEPVQQDEPEPVRVMQQSDSKRAIEYTRPGRSHGPRQRILDSPLLQFVQNSEEFRRLGALYTAELLPYRRIDWEVLDRLGARTLVEQLLGPKFRKILDCDARQYKEITIEFHSTFDYKLGSFNKKGAIFFALGRKSYEMTVPEFARSVNLATVFAMSIKRLWRGGAGARIYCGPLITWLAESLGVFERYPADKMKKGPDPCLMSVRDLQSAAIIARTDPITWEPIERVHRFSLRLVRVLRRLCRISGLRQEVLAEIVAGQRRLEDGMRVIMQGIRVQSPPSWQPSEAGSSGTHAGDED
ncbi:hypothetical protein Hdeb2414_s0062g00763971 [Helianthus debilis subsp. tardiflorus]